MTFKKFKWRENLNTRFTNNFNILFETMKESILNKLDVSINDCVQSIVEMYHKAADCMLVKMVCLILLNKNHGGIVNVKS